MKKKLLFLLVGGLFLLGGCGKATESDIIKDWKSIWENVY
jgi:hypothetical protein